jgi:hypothetical protein
VKSTTAETGLHTARPSIYLDQWVWIRLASADLGEPRENSDLAVLAAVRKASQAGVAFPLSSTHYMETSKITNPRQRAELARTMASISRCRTLRSARVLLRHQMLNAMHEIFGRPVFRPQPPEALGTGVIWAFTGKPGPLTLHDSSGPVDPAAIPGMPDFLRKANQFVEMRMLAGPADDELEHLHGLGYRPDATRQVEASRLAWEETYRGLLADDPVSRAELRVRVQAREICHEHLRLLGELLTEYHLSLSRGMGYDPACPNRSRSKMIAFADLMPSVRIAVDLKVELFRNAATTWTMNAINDIDAVSMAVPYCHVVVPDKEMADLLARSRAGTRNGTQIVRKLTDLPDLLPPLVRAAQAADGDVAGWDWAGPSDGFCLDMGDLLASAPIQPSAA